MKTILLALAFLCTCTLSVSAQKELPRLKKMKQSKADPDVWDITLNEKLILKYQQPKEVAAAVESEAKLKLWSSEEKALQLSKKPAGGWLTTRLVRGTLSGADPNVLTFVIQNAEGQEMQRFQPSPALPSPFSALGQTVYVGIVAVPVSKPLQAGDRVFVIDDVEKVRFEYEIRPL